MNSSNNSNDSLLAGNAIVPPNSDFLGRLNNVSRSTFCKSIQANWLKPPPRGLTPSVIYDKSRAQQSNCLLNKPGTATATAKKKMLVFSSWKTLPSFRSAAGLWPPAGWAIVFNVITMSGSPPPT
jgi:hypothetical protein